MANDDSYVANCKETFTFFPHTPTEQMVDMGAIFCRRGHLNVDCHDWEWHHSFPVACQRAPQVLNGWNVVGFCLEIIPVIFFSFQ